MTAKPALGKGLASLIPQAKTSIPAPAPKPEPKKQESSSTTNVVDISVDDIKENPHQPRYHFSPSDLEDLIASIKEHGILQPLVVTKDGDKYELIAGERRLRASRTLGLKTVPVIVRDANEQQKLELAIIENIQRQDLNAVEEAIAYKALIDEFSLTQNEVAKRVGKSRPVVANTIRLLELPDEMLDALKAGEISKTHARNLLAEPDPVKRQMLFEAMMTGELTTAETEARAGNTGARSSAKSGKTKDPNVLAHEKRLREILGTKVDISESAGKGKISISFYSREELLELLDRLMD